MDLESYFENNANGLANNVEGGGAGNFSVYNSVFKGSTNADLTISNTEQHTARNNFSINSKKFYYSTGGGQNGSMTAVTGNVILDTLDSEAIYVGDWGPATVNDNVIRSRASNTGPAIKMNVPSDMLTAGNKINTTISASGRWISFDNQVVTRASITNAEPILPFKSPKTTRQVFEVPTLS